MKNGIDCHLAEAGQPAASAKERLASRLPRPKRGWPAG